MRLRVGAIRRLVKEILELARVLEAGAGDLGGKVQVDGLRNPALQLTERIPCIFPHSRRGDHPLAVFPHSDGRRLLIGILDSLFGVFGEDRLVAREDQNWGPRGVGRRDGTYHVGEAWSLRSRGRRHFPGRSRERVSGITQRPFVTTTIGRDARVGDRVHGVVVARTAEERLDTLFLARASKHLGTAHRKIDGRECRCLGRRELVGNGDRFDVAFRWRSGERCTARSECGRGCAGTHDGVLHEVTTGFVGCSDLPGLLQ